MTWRERIGARALGKFDSFTKAPERPIGEAVGSGRTGRRLGSPSGLLPALRLVGEPREIVGVAPTIGRAVMLGTS